MNGEQPGDEHGGGDRPHSVCVFQASQLHACFDASLVLTSQSIDNSVQAQADNEGTPRVGGRQWCVYVAAADAHKARTELTAYVRENSVQPIAPRPTVEFDSGWYGALGFLLVIWCVPWLQGSQALFDAPQQWLEQGRMQAGLVMQGQWWRTVTALTLHSGLPHLLSNSVFGIVFGLYLGRYLGSGFGWLMVLLAAAAGNYLNAAMRPAEFNSIGASTANFAIVGLMGTFVWRRGYLRGPDWRRGMAPIVASLALLAFLGVGDERTDVLAHFTGFVCGALFGYVIPKFNVRRLGQSGQLLCGAVALLLVVNAWRIAFNAGQAN